MGSTASDVTTLWRYRNVCITVIIIITISKAAVKRELLDTVKARKLAHYGHTMMKQRSRLEKEITQGTTPGARRRGRPRTAWMEKHQ